MNINYVISNYVGARRFAPKLQLDPLFYIKSHCNYFTNNKLEGVSKITFVLNKSDDYRRDEEFIDYVNNIKLSTEHELIVRDNIGFSYGAWQSVVEKNKDFDYHFLLEDDYIPRDNKIIENFFNAMQNKDKTVFVCCIYENGHCAMSSGLLNTKIVNKEITEGRLNLKMILNAEKIQSSDYALGVNNQRIFLKNFEELGYNIKDLAKENKWLFVNHLGDITHHGNPMGTILLEPLDYNFYNFYKLA